MDKGRPWEPVVRAYVDRINGVIRERLTTFRDALDVWLNGILAGPIPDDWRERLDQFEQEMATYGIGIRPHSIDALARLIESRARGAGQPAPEQRQVRSTIAADGAFVQSVIPNASGPPEGVPQRDAAMAETRPLWQRRSALNLSSEALFHEKLDKARGHFQQIERLLEALGEKLDGAEPGADVDVDQDVAQIEEQLFLYNDALESARDVWLRAEMPAEAYNRLTAIPSPAGIGLPLFSLTDQAKRADRQRARILQRLHQDNASMDRAVATMEVADFVGTVAGLAAGAGFLISAGKTGGRWAVAKAVAVGAVAFAADKAAESGLRAVGAGEATIRGARLAAAIATYILLRRRGAFGRDGARPAAPVAPPSSPVPESYINPRFTIDMSSAPAGSAINAAGSYRNGPWFWRQMLSENPELFSPANRAAISAGRSPTVDPTWVAQNPTHQSFIGSRLIHHHIQQGSIATGLPEPIHRAWHASLHPER